jgi:hypothetical protein
MGERERECLHTETALYWDAIVWLAVSRRQQPSKTRSARVSSEVLGGLSTSVRASVALGSGFFTAHLCGTNVCSNSTGTTALSHTRNTAKNTHFILLLLRLNLKQTPKAHCNVCVGVCIWERDRERQRETERLRDRERAAFLTQKTPQRTDFLLLLLLLLLLKLVLKQNF